ncbi:MAG: hypothetical protein KF764_12540 [Labilithrix sp.]|nr:hypothetical protein [Labilithrix sp.]
MRVRSLVILSVLAAALAALFGLACGASAFDSQSKVTSVRMFGVRPDKPYAKPGETVTLEVLSADGRKDKPRPLEIFWIPIVCVNPRDDLYYLCFLPSQSADGGTIDGGTRLVAPFPPDGGTAPPDGGAGGGGLSSIPVGIDLGPFLPKGPKFSFQMPDDIIQPRLGGPAYGLAIVFNIACAGQVRLAERVGNAPQQVPIQCTDEEGVPLSPDDYVIGINRVYAYADRTNANPVVERVTLDGVDVDVDAGITVERCVAGRRADCKPVKIDVKVSDSSWEENPSSGAAVGQREQIWVTYYSDLGDFRDEARLLFDATEGRISESDVEFRPPYAPSEGTIWAVVHDNRAGAAFVVLPLHVK